MHPKFLEKKYGNIIYETIDKNWLGKQINKEDKYNSKPIKKSQKILSIKINIFTNSNV